PPGERYSLLLRRSAQEPERKTCGRGPGRAPEGKRQGCNRCPPRQRNPEKSAGKKCRARDQQWPPPHRPPPPGSSHVCVCLHRAHPSSTRYTPFAIGVKPTLDLLWRFLLKVPSYADFNVGQKATYPRPGVGAELG